MSGNKYFLDTNAVLFILNGDKTLIDFLYQKELYISIISEMELLSYKDITIEEMRILKEFLTELQITDINDLIKFAAIAVKKSSSMKLPDSIIAGTAIFLKMPLITSDKKFKTVSGLNVLYYEK